MASRHRNIPLSSMLVGSLAIVPAMAAVGVLLIMMATTQTAEARVTRIVVNEKISPAFNGRTFGSTGQYEQLNGIAYGEVDPQDPQNALIQDIDLAPRNREGKVEYSMDISILKPVDPARGNHVLLYDIVNRGRKIIPTLFNIDATDSNPAGDGFLEDQGFTMVWSGWQADLVPAPVIGRLAMTAPIARTKDGRTITGIVRSEISSLTAPVQTSPILGGLSTASRGYQPVSADTSRATLTQRGHAQDPREPIPSTQWAFGSCNPTFPSVTPDPPDAAQFHVCKQGGFDANHIYELIYEAQDPQVLGLGFASTRDFIAFLHHSTDVQNPLVGTIQYPLMHGTSQSGRYARTFLHLGFNRDEDGRKVFEGMNPHITTARITMNTRFGQPGRGGGFQHTQHEYAGLESPMTWSSYDDQIAKVKGDILMRCRETRTCPKILQTVTDTEYWQSSMSSDTTDSVGEHDLIVSDNDRSEPQLAAVSGTPESLAQHDRMLPENVRIYHLASTQHSGYSAVGAVPPARTPVCQQLPNANSYTYNLRAILMALENWVVAGKAPPASRYPQINKGTLVRSSQVAFPKIPNVSARLDVLLNIRTLYYRGAEFDASNESGYESAAPPTRIADYTTLVPEVDNDGNDIDGVHSLSLMVPLGTYTGWNTRSAGFGEGDACDLIGSFIPFPKTVSDATISGDPRKPIASRYPSSQVYDRAVEAAARTLVSQGFLLSSDEAAAVLQVKTQAHNSGLLPP